MKCLQSSGCAAPAHCSVYVFAANLGIPPCQRIHVRAKSTGSQGWFHLKHLTLSVSHYRMLLISNQLCVCVCMCAAAGDRVLTPWLTVLGKGLDGMPLVEVQLRRAGDELKGVKARVSLLPALATGGPYICMCFLHTAAVGSSQGTQRVQLRCMQCLLCSATLAVGFVVVALCQCAYIVRA